MLTTLIKPDTIDVILDYFHRFDKNICFTYDLSENTTPHFLDINISPNGTGIYRKDTFSGQYNNFDSFIPWHHKISWIRALVDCIHRICSPNTKTSKKDHHMEQLCVMYCFCTYLLFLIKRSQQEPHNSQHLQRQIRDRHHLASFSLYW